MQDTSQLDPPLRTPAQFPCETPKCKQERFAHTPTYDALETNTSAKVMQFTQEPIPEVRSNASVAMFGAETPFRHRTVIQQYLQSLFERKGYEKLVEYNTTVEKAQKQGNEWVLTLRRSGADRDEWWQERFDALVVCSGHYSVPNVPKIPGLAELERLHPSTVEHAKHYRNRERYRGQKVIVVGSSVSGMDTALDLVNTVQTPLISSSIGYVHPFFGDLALQHPKIERHSEITHISPEDRIVYFKDGAVVRGVDRIILGTGYLYSYPFLEHVCLEENRVHGLYLHVVSIDDPTLDFVRAIEAGLTFKEFEWQAVLVSRLLAGRVQLPPVAEQRRWEAERIKERGIGARFTAVFPDYEQYFETLRTLAGNDGPGRKLPKFDQGWLQAFEEGHQIRRTSWGAVIERERLNGARSHA